MVFGTEEFNMSDQDFADLYLNKLTPTERKYYDCWTKWKRFKIPPWRFLNQKKVTREMYLTLEQIDNMYHNRLKIKEHKDQITKDQANFRPFQNMQPPHKKVQSVL